MSQHAVDAGISLQRNPVWSCRLRREQERARRELELKAATANNIRERNLAKARFHQEFYSQSAHIGAKADSRAAAGGSAPALRGPAGSPSTDTTDPSPRLDPGPASDYPIHRGQGDGPRRHASPSRLASPPPVPAAMPPPLASAFPGQRGVRPVLSYDDIPVGAAGAAMLERMQGLPGASTGANGHPPEEHPRGFYPPDRSAAARAQREEAAVGPYTARQGGGIGREFARVEMPVSARPSSREQAVSQHHMGRMGSRPSSREQPSGRPISREAPRDLPGANRASTLGLGMLQLPSDKEMSYDDLGTSGTLSTSHHSPVDAQAYMGVSPGFQVRP